MRGDGCFTKAGIEWYYPMFTDGDTQEGRFPFGRYLGSTKYKQQQKEETALGVEVFYPKSTIAWAQSPQHTDPHRPVCISPALEGRGGEGLSSD